MSVNMGREDNERNVICSESSCEGKAVRSILNEVQEILEDVDQRSRRAQVDHMLLRSRIRLQFDPISRANVNEVIEYVGNLPSKLKVPDDEYSPEEDSHQLESLCQEAQSVLDDNSRILDEAVAAVDAMKSSSSPEEDKALYNTIMSTLEMFDKLDVNIENPEVTEEDVADLLAELGVSDISQVDVNKLAELAAVNFKQVRECFVQAGTNEEVIEDMKFVFEDRFGDHLDQDNCVKMKDFQEPSDDSNVFDDNEFEAFLKNQEDQLSQQLKDANTESEKLDSTEDVPKRNYVDLGKCVDQAICSPEACTDSANLVTDSVTTGLMDVGSSSNSQDFVNDDELCCESKLEMTARNSETSSQDTKVSPVQESSEVSKSS